MTDACHGQGVAGWNSLNKRLTNMTIDEDNGGLVVNSYIWDTDTLSWIRDTGSSGTGSSNTSYLETRYEFDNAGNPIYIGKHQTFGADVSDISWDIFKYTWDASGNIERKQGPLSGAWTNRAALSW